MDPCDPPLTAAQRKFAIQQFCRYLTETDQLQVAIQVMHSGMIHRLLSGKELFDDPPPRHMSQPWYALLDGEEQFIWEKPWSWNEQLLVVAQCQGWEWEKEGEILRYGKWRFAYKENAKVENGHSYHSLKRIEDAPCTTT
jgi:hypothetical protein